jgi:hypothetical protein
LVEHLAEGLGGVRSMRRAERSQGDMQLAIGDADVACSGEQLMQQGPPLLIDTGVVRSQSKKSVQRLKTKVRELLVSGNNAPWQDVRDTLNRFLRGWSNYFCHGTRRPAFRGVDQYVYERVRDFLARRHKVAGRGTKRFSYEVVYQVFMSRTLSKRAT